MKKHRILSFILAVAMILPMTVIGASAKTVYAEKNIIEPIEECLIPNGTFDEEPLLNNKGGIGASYQNAVDGYWNYSTFFEGNTCKLVWDSENKWLVVDTNASPSISYAVPGVVQPGTYIFSFDFYAESKIDGVRYQFFNDKGSSYENLTGLTHIRTDATGARMNETGKWYTVNLELTLTEETDLVFRLLSGLDDAGNIRFDNVALARPSDVLIETANMESVSTTAVSAVTSTAPVNGAWTVGDTTYLNLDNSGEGIHVLRKPDATKLPDQANASFTFPEKLSAGEYKITFDLSATASQNYVFDLADVTNGSWSRIQNMTTISNGKVSQKFTITGNERTVAFRMWPNSIPAYVYSLDNLKLEKLVADDNSFTNDLQNVADVTVRTGGSWQDAVCYNRNTITAAVTAKDQVATFALENGTLHYKAKTQAETQYTGTGDTKSTPTTAFGLGTLEAGNYTISFDIKTTVSTTYNPRVHYSNSGLKTPATVSWNSFAPTKDAWQTITGNFTVAESEAGFPYLFRFWPNADGAEYYLDNVKLVKHNDYVFTNKTFDDANDFCLSANNISGAGNPCAWATKTRSDSFFGGNGTITTAEIVEITENNQKNKVLRLANTEGTPAFGYNFGWLPKGSYTLTFKTKPLTTSIGSVNRGVYDVSANTLSGITLKTNDIGMTDGQWRNNTVAFDITADSGAKVLMRIWFSKAVDFYIDDFKIEGTTPWFKYIDKDFSTADQAEVSTLGWNLTQDTFSYANGTFDCSAHDGYLDATYVSGGPSLIYSFGNLAAGSYVVVSDAKSGKDAGFTYQQRYGDGTGSAGVGFGIIVYKDYWTYNKLEFKVTDSSNLRHTVRYYPNTENDRTDLAIDNLQFWGTAPIPAWETVYEEKFNSAPSVVNDKSVNITSPEAKANAGKWYSRDITPSQFSYNATEKRLDIVPNTNLIYASANPGNALMNHTPLYYGFENSFTKGDYTIAFKLTADYKENYYVAAIDRSGNVLAAKGIQVDAGATANDSLMFSVKSDCDVLFMVAGRNALRCFAAFTIDDVEVYKLTNPIYGFNSNGAIAQFDAAEGTYYMVTGIQGANGYINYSNSEDIDKGVYRLSGYFRTTDADGAAIRATVGYLPMEEVYEIGEEWTKVTYTFALSRDDKLSTVEGVRFTLEGNSTFYFKDLELVFVEELPQPALNSGIAMVLLKKMQGKMKPKVEKKLYNFMANADFDEEPTIRETLLNYGWGAQQDGEWAVSINSADNGGTGSIKWAECKKEKALFVEASKTNPCISYKLPGTLTAGLYTLSFDTFIEGAGQKGFMIDVFDMQTGSAVRIGEGAAIMSRSAKAGEWSTMTVTFTAPANAKVLFRFWSGSPLSYYVDNIKITTPGVFSDGTVEEVVNDTEGLIANGGFDSAPVISAKELGYGWANHKDGEWNYSLNYIEQKDAKCTLSYGEVKGEKCLKVDTNSGPSVSYAVNGKMKSGVYTLKFDIYAEKDGTHTFSIDVFDLATGSFVRTTAGAAMVNAKVKGGEWTTVSVPFTVTGQAADIVFRFFTPSKINFYVDNVAIK